MKAEPVPVNYYDLLKRAPKADVHIHFEGAFSRDYAKAQFPPGQCPFRVFPRHDPTTWPTFSRVFQHTLTFIRSRNDIVKLAVEIAGDLRKHNVVYAELIVSVGLLRRNGLSMTEIVRSLDYSRKFVRDIHNVQIEWLLGISRGSGPRAANRLIHDVICAGGQEIFCGVNLCGNELQSETQTDHFARCLRSVRRYDWKVSIHCGEFESPIHPPGHGISTAVNTIECDRIDHGISLHHRPDLYPRVQTRMIGITACPSSNQALGRTRPDSPYPFHAYLREGLLITVGTDDPGYFGTNLVKEIMFAIQDHDLSLTDVHQLLRNAMRISFRLSETAATTNLDKIDAIFHQILEDAN